MANLNRETWTKVYVGKILDVYGIYGERRGDRIFQTADKSGELTGFRFGNNLDAAKDAADSDGS